MSLCYESEKWLMITLASIAISLTVGLFFINFAYGQSDFYLEAKSSHVTGEHNLDTTRLEIQGNLSEQMCPSMQCIADFRYKHTSFSPPDIPESTSIGYNFEFTLQDNITNADLGPKKKELV